MRRISRVFDVSINTVTKLLEDAGEACRAAHGELVQNARASRLQCDEIWSFGDSIRKERRYEQNRRDFG